MADEIKPKKSIWKRWWIWVIIVFVIIIVAAASGGDRERDLEPETTAPEQKVSEEKPEEKIESTTLGERNALRAAKHYLDTMPFSRSDLIKQLEFEGYTSEQAEYGASVVGY